MNGTVSLHPLINRPSWRIWTDLRDLVSTFDTDDVMQRIIILFTLTCLLGFTINMTQGLEGTLTMIVTILGVFELIVDRILRYCSVVSGGIASFLGAVSSVYETYLTGHGERQYCCFGTLD